LSYSYNEKEEATRGNCSTADPVKNNLKRKRKVMKNVYVVSNNFEVRVWDNIMHEKGAKIT